MQKFALSLLFSLVWLGPGRTILANQLLSVSAHSDASADLVLLQFASPLAEEPRLETSQGLARIVFANTDLGPGLSGLKPDLDLVREITLHHVGSDAVLELDFQNILFDSAGKVNWSGSGPGLAIKVVRAVPAAAATTPSTFDQAPWYLGLKVIVSLTFVLLLILAGFKLYQKLLLQRTSLFNANDRPKILAVYHLGPKQKLWRVAFQGADFLLGVTPHALSLISRMDNAQTALVERLLREPGMDIAMLRASLEMEAEKVRAEKAKPVKNLLATNNAQAFKDELLKRIKSFKSL